MDSYLAFRAHFKCNFIIKLCTHIICILFLKLSSFRLTLSSLGEKRSHFRDYTPRPYPQVQSINVQGLNKWKAPCVMGTTSAETWRWMWVSVLIMWLYAVKESYSTSVSQIGKYTIYKWWARREQASFRNDWEESSAHRDLHYHHFRCFLSSTGPMGSHYREMISLQGWTANFLC